MDDLLVKMIAELQEFSIEELGEIRATWLESLENLASEDVRNFCGHLVDLVVAHKIQDGGTAA